MVRVLIAVLLLLSLGCGAKSPKPIVHASAEIGESVQWSRPSFDFVPADTPYLAVLGHVANDQQIDQPTPVEQASYDSIMRKLREAATAGEANGNPLPKAFAGLTKYSNLSEALDAIGIDPRLQAIIYGHGLSPVIRIAVKDINRLTTFITEAMVGEAKWRASRIGAAYVWQMAIESEDKEANEVVLTVHRNEIVAALVPAAQLPETLPFLIGSKPHPTPLAKANNVQQLLATHKLLPHGYGWLDMGRMMALATERFSGSGQAQNAACVAWARDVTAGFNRLVFGQRAASKNRSASRVALDMSPAKAKELRSIVSQVGFVPNSTRDSALMSFSLHLDIEKTIALFDRVLGTFAAVDSKCTAIAEESASFTKSRLELNSLLAILPPGVVASKSVYGQFDKFDVEQKIFEGFVAIDSEDISLLLALAQGVLNTQIPTDGVAVALPLSLLPIPVHAAATKTRGVIAIGPESEHVAEAVAADKSKGRQPLAAMRLNFQQVLAVMQAEDGDEVDPEKAADRALLAKLGDMAMTLDVTENGLVLDLDYGWLGSK